MKEGILEKAGPVFAFSHDMLQESTYRLIPRHERKFMHKKIGTTLTKEAQIDENAELCILAVDQIIICKGLDGIFDSEERTQFAQLHLIAGKYAVSATRSNYKQGKEFVGTHLKHQKLVSFNSSF